VTVHLLGHRGVIGSAIAAYLRESGIDVVGIDRESYPRHRGTRCELLINAAGSSDRRAAAADPHADLLENVVGTSKALLDLSPERYVHISTVGVYARISDPARTSEDEPIDPLALDPYGFDKALAELVVRRSAARWIILRLGPIVGPELRKNAVYDLVHRRRLYVHPDSSLPYIHTDALARIVWELREAENEIINVTGDGSIRLADVATMVGVHVDPEWSSQPREDFAIDVRKLKARTMVPSTRASLGRYLAEAGGIARGAGSGVTNPPR
jgi:nucleoside-diphosphate-sugar epimerase